MDKITDCLRFAHPPPPTIGSFSTQFISSGSRIYDLLKGGGKNFFAIFNFSVRRRGDKFKVVLINNDDIAVPEALEKLRIFRQIAKFARKLQK